MKTQAERDAGVLSFDPFEGDWDYGSDYRVFRDRIQAARKDHKCFFCGATIQPGERYRSMFSRMDGETMTHKWCPGCCAAMEQEAETDGSTFAYSERLNIHINEAHND